MVDIQTGLKTVGQTTTVAVNQWQMNMPQGVTPLSRDIYDLHIGRHGSLCGYWYCRVWGDDLFLDVP